MGYKYAKRDAQARSGRRAMQGRRFSEIEGEMGVGVRGGPGGDREEMSPERRLLRGIDVTERDAHSSRRRRSTFEKPGGREGRHGFRRARRWGLKDIDKNGNNITRLMALYFSSKQNPRI